MGVEDITYKAIWAPSTDTVYTVKHIREDLSDSYPVNGNLVETENKLGTTKELTKAEAKNYEGFSAEVIEQVEILPDGTTEVEIKYSRNEYSVNWICEEEIHETKQVKYGKEITAPINNPTKQGYIFASWSGLSQGATMGISDQTYTAMWDPATDTIYTIKHIREDLSGNYTIEEIEEKNGTTKTKTRAFPKDYEGFSVDENYSQIDIEPDGSSIVTIMYNRNSYNITWVSNSEVFETTNNVKYGEMINLPDGTPDNKKGYTFSQWSSVPDTMPAKNISYEARFTANVYTVTFNINGGEILEFNSREVTYDTSYGELPNATYIGYQFVNWTDESGAIIRKTTMLKTSFDHELIANWKARTDTSYRVEHYLENVDGVGYTLKENVTLYGKTDTDTVASSNNYVGFTVKSFSQEKIAGNETTVIKIYYDRNMHTVIWNMDKTSNAVEYRYGQSIIEPDAKRTGYIFAGWDVALASTMPDIDLSYMAIWDLATDTIYTIKHIREDLSGNYTIEEIEEKNGTTKTKTRAFPKDYEGFSVDENYSQIDIEPDGSSIVTIMYSRNSYNITWISNSEVFETTNNVKYGEMINLLDGTPDNKKGYTFSQWSSVPDTMPAKNISYEASFTANTYTVTFNANGGETLEFNRREVTYDTSYGDLPNATYVGYQFVNWTDESGAIISKTTMLKTSSDHELIANWAAKTDVAYTIEHYLENVDGVGYTLKENVTLYGKTDTDTVATTNNYVGFTVKSFSQEKISGDETTVVKIYYERNVHTVTWNIDKTSNAVEYRYGQSIIEPDATCTGYIFAGWDVALSSTMPDIDLSYTAMWDLATDTIYTIKHIREDLSGNYTIEEIEEKNGTTKTKTRAFPKDYEGFSVDENYSQIDIEPDGSSIVTIMYNRNSYNITWISNNEVFETTNNVKYGEMINLPDGTPDNKKGYTFSQWSSVPDTMPAKNISYEASFTANVYTVTFNANGGETLEFNRREVTYDTSYGDLPNATYVGYQFVNWTDESGAIISKTTMLKTSFDHELIANWKARTDTSYIVEHYLENVDGVVYTLKESVTLYGETDTDTVASSNNYVGFTVKSFSQEKIAGNETTVIKIYYDRNMHTVIWNIDKTSNAVEYRYGQSIIKPDAKRTGYIFEGWDVALASTMPDIDLSYMAIWTPKQYEITFNGNGGSSPSAITVTYDSTYLGLSESTQKGYDFVGWFTSLSGGTEILDSTKVQVTANQILYAHWTARQYKVSFDLNTGVGTPPQAITVTYDDSYTTLPENSASKTGYTFKGWYTAASGGIEVTKTTSVTSTNDHTLFAKWQANIYMVIFDANGGTGTMENQDHTYDQSKSLSANGFSKIGYSFSGWNTEENGSGTDYENIANVTNLANKGSITLYAKWEVNEYSISFNSNGGSSVPSILQNYGTPIIAPADPTKEGYRFDAWQSNGVDYTFSIMPAENITLTARWNVVDYGITYELNGGTNHEDNPLSYNIESGNIVLREASDRVGYTFEGWYKEAEYINKVEGIAILQGVIGAKTFYARWTPNTYTVIFNKNTGDGTTSTNQIFTYDDAPKALAENTFELEGYTFAGWNTKSDGTGTDYTQMQVVQNLSESAAVNLYAKWDIVTYSITYNLNSGTQASNNPISYSVESNDIILEDPSRDGGYGFEGWYDNASFTGNKVISITKGSTGNKTLYAKWGFAGTFTVKNNLNNTFTITRSGNGNINDKQHVGQQIVYFRTVNGSAIGGTHFYHLGGNASAVTFLDGETSKTVTVTEYGVTRAYNGYTATMYSNVDRTYQFEIVKVDGGGLLGSTTKATRTMMKSSSYEVPVNTFEYKSFASQDETIEISEKIDGSFTATKYIGLSGNSLAGRSDSGNVKIYLQNTIEQMKVKLDIRGKDDGWGMIRYAFFNNHTNNTSSGKASDAEIGTLPTGTKAAFVYGTLNDNRVSYAANLPGSGDYLTAKRLDGSLILVPLHKTKYAAGQNNNGEYIIYGLDETVGISVATYHHRLAISSYFHEEGTLYSAPYDTKEPSKIGIAPMATGDYSVGETVTIAVVFDEIVANLNGATISGTNLNAMTYSGGIGSNVLYFTGNVKNNCNQDSILTGINVNGTVLDMAN